MRRVAMSALACAMVVGLAATVSGTPQATLSYTVTIYNLTHAQIFSPPVVATHNEGTRIFRAGGVAGTALRQLAEDGSPVALQTLLLGNTGVMSVAVADGPILPGGMASFDVTAMGQFDRLSAVGMLVTTNDAFFGLDSMDIDFNVAASPAGVTVLVPAYDAGTENNSESCAFIPGPPCGNGGVRDLLGAEGFIHVSRGIHGIGDIDAAQFDWRNPVAKIVIQRRR